MKEGNALNILTTEKGRRYIDAAHLTEISGLPVRDFDLKYRPGAWAIPRDFVWRHGKMWFALLSLPQLFDELQAVNPDAALRLRERLLPWVEAAVAETPGAHVSSASPAPVCTKPQAEQKSWMQQWEEAHAK